MSIQSELQKFYDAEAEKYYQTRNKHRADADIFLDEIKNCGKKTVNILEFWCGSGRLLVHLAQLTWVNIKYTGVDISKNLLNFAKKQISGASVSKHIKATFIHDDIIHTIAWYKQESFDFVLGAASFQHIPTEKQRFYLIKNIYRILKYDGKLIMTNRSFSRRFLKKYQYEILRALRNYVTSLGKYQRNNIMIPRKNGKTVAKRFYHIYTTKEIEKILVLSGFLIKKNNYLKKWKVVLSRKQSENSCIVGQKTVFLKNE